MVKSVEAEHSSPTSAAHLTLQRWMERIAKREVARITARCQCYQEQRSYVPGWVQSGVGERFSSSEHLEHRIQMLLGIFAAKGVLPLVLKPAYSVGDLLLQHLDALEQEVDKKGAVQQALANHFTAIARHIPAGHCSKFQTDATP